MGVALICQLSLTGSAAAATASLTAKAAPTPSGAVAPNKVSEVDCNGWSPKYPSVKQVAGMTCVDPIKINKNGVPYRFTDNGHYVGHDEPSVKFISSTPGSGNTMTYLTKLPVDPAAAPTTSTLRVTHYSELSVAPWFGLPMCDPHSYPQNSCTPDSDSNSGLVSDPNAAGSAFMELQLYPPGDTPFIDSESCSATQWCAALNIDSLECTFGFATCNFNCEEPVNFAFLQTNGIPSGPPSPQLTNVDTYLGNSNTLKMNAGDVLQVSITDPPAGFTTTIRDLTTHQTGYMVASASNGFKNTNIADCSGDPWTFHAEYSSAQQQNQVPWAAAEAGVLMEQEIGHSEVCSSVTNNDPFAVGYANGQSFADNNTYDTCVGNSEGAGQTGEGPCNAATGVCQNAETQGTNGPVACPVNNFFTGALCEFADGLCFQQGTRTVQINGVDTTAVTNTNQCFANRYQNGDLDFNGVDYQPGPWPNGSRNQPTAFQYLGPFQANGKPYPTVQFETDIAGSEILCDTVTGAGCTAPPAGANFYPYWSLSFQPTFTFGTPSPLGTGCIWNFGNSLPNTVLNFGKDAQYGTPNIARYGGTIISAPMPNPQFSPFCKAI